MRKSVNGIITAIFFFLLMIGAAGADAQEPQGAILLIVIGIVGLISEGCYWRRVYER